MKPESVTKIQGLVERIWQYQRKFAGDLPQDQLIDKIREFLSNPGMDVWTYNQARRAMPFDGFNDFAPSDTLHLLKLLEPEAQRDYLLTLPESRGRVIRSEIELILKQALPGFRQEMLNRVKTLPKKPAGRPSKMPPDDICRKICKGILKLIGQGYSIGVGQRRMRDYWGINLRTIQRIWARRYELLKSNQELQDELETET